VYFQIGLFGMENKEEINALLDVLKRISRLSKEDIENLDFGSFHAGGTLLQFFSSISPIEN